jgi:type I restriction enzyme S subunit
VAIVSEKDVPCLLLQRVASLRTDEALNKEYLRLQLSGEAFIHHFLPDMTGVSVPHISPGQIGSFVIIVPPRDEQDQIVNFIGEATSQFDTLTATAQSAITLLQERRAALISAAVTGKIDVRGLVPELAGAA